MAHAQNQVPRTRSTRMSFEVITRTSMCGELYL